MDKIVISKLRLQAIIGVYDRERIQPQPIIIDLEIDHDTRQATVNDQLTAALDYEKVISRIKELVKQYQFFLIETLANTIADLLLVEFNIKKLKLGLFKPEAIAEAENVGVIIKRSKSPFSRLREKGVSN